MKQIILIASCLCLLSCHYIRNGGLTNKVTTLPSFNMLLLDSTTLLSSLQISEGKPLIIFYVRPDCPHCQQETNECISNIKSLKAFEILFLTSATQKDTKEYAKKYHLDDYKNITVGRDFENSFIRVFRPTYVPYIAIYDTQKKLIKIYDGEVSFENIIRSFHS